MPQLLSLHPMAWVDNPLPNSHFLFPLLGSGGGIGRHAAFRSQCRKTCGFESRPEYRYMMGFEPARVWISELFTGERNGVIPLSGISAQPRLVGAALAAIQSRPEHHLNPYFYRVLRFHGIMLIIPFKLTPLSFESEPEGSSLRVDDRIDNILICDLYYRMSHLWRWANNGWTSQIWNRRHHC